MTPIDTGIISGSTETIIVDPNGVTENGGIRKEAAVFAPQRPNEARGLRPKFPKFDRR